MQKFSINYITQLRQNKFHRVCNFKSVKFELLLFNRPLSKILLNKTAGGIMEIAAHKKKKALIISAKGRIDTVTAPQFENSLFDFISKGEKFFIIDFAHLEYIGSAGLRSILATAKKLKENKGEMLFAALQGPVKEVFRISGFNSIFQIFTTDEEALATIE
jgi:anti-anti-sigma factor